MAQTTVATGLSAKKWDSKFFTEYLSKSRYTASYGSDENAIIQVKEDLSKGKGDAIVIALVNRLRQQAVLGSNMMEGNEEDMSSRSMDIRINKRRNAVSIPEMEEWKSAIDLRDGARATLQDWAQKDTENLISQQLLSIDGVLFGTATAAQRNTWLNNNFDRVQFGALAANSGTAGSAVHATAMATLDNTDDKLTPQALSIMKTRAIECDPKITPIRETESKGRRYYIAYCSPRVFRDLKTNATMMQAQREVTLEMENSRLFEGGDLLWDGIICKEIPDLMNDPVTGSPSYPSNGTIACGPVLLCGAQAVGLVYGKRWRTIIKQFDYDDKFGIAIDGIYGVRKIIFGTGTNDTDTPKDNGVVTGWFAAQPTA
jgi:N4-gp56 family major capsid protein